jgi:hypothetical protein
MMAVLSELGEAAVQFPSVRMRFALFFPPLRVRFLLFFFVSSLL